MDCNHTLSILRLRLFIRTLKEADAIVLVYDISSHESLVTARNYVTWLKKTVFTRDKQEFTSFMLIGNKLDLEQQNGGRQVTRDEGIQLARVLYGALHYEVSAATGLKVEEAFKKLANTIQTNSRNNTFQEINDFKKRSQERRSQDCFGDCKIC